MKMKGQLVFEKYFFEILGIIGCGVSIVILLCMIPEHPKESIVKYVSRSKLFCNMIPFVIVGVIGIYGNYRAEKKLKEMARDE